MTHTIPYRRYWLQGITAFLILSLTVGITTVRAAPAAAVAAAPAGSIVPLTTFDAGTNPSGLVYGLGSSLWVSLPGSGEIGQITNTVASTHALTDQSARPWDIIIGADQALWFGAGNLNQIGRLPPDGELTNYSLGTGSASAIPVALGQDLALWFTEPEANRIGRLTTSGQFTHFDLPQANSKPVSILSAKNGDLWFAEWGSYRIGRISLQGEITEYNLPKQTVRPVDMLLGPDGNLWVIFNTGKTIARFDTHSEMFDYYPLATLNASLSDLTIGPDNKIWFIGTNTIGSFELINGAPANLWEEALPSPVYAYQGRTQIITGPDNNLVFTTANTSTIYQSVLSGKPALRDLQVFITYHPPLLLSAGEFNIDADIVNWTNTDANAIELNLTLDESIHLISADLPAGSCVDHGLSVRCMLPALGAGSSLPVRFVMTTDRITTSPSPRTLSLEVLSAEGDYQPANNRVVMSTTIQSSLEYFNNFSVSAGDHWSHPITSSPVNGLDVLGLFDNDQVSFDWDVLPPHDSLRMCFDLYIMGPWSGSQFLDQDDTTPIGPDLWTSYVNDDLDNQNARRLTFTSFSNQKQYTQAFPANYREAVFPPQTSAYEVGEYDGHSTMRDTRYHFCYRLHHSALSLNLVLKGLNLDGMTQEKWAIDDVRIKLLYDASLDEIYLPILRR